jgi:nucleoside-triphosphatase
MADLHPATCWAARPAHLIVTGAIGAGKTTWCQQLVALAQADGARVRGLLSPAVFTGATKTGIALVDLASGETRALAHLRTADQTDGGIATQRWRFDAETIAWGNAILAAITTADLLVVDEIGPLELERGEGFTHALPLIAAGASRMTCVVVRVHLLGQMLAHLPRAMVVEIAG